MVRFKPVMFAALAFTALSLTACSSNSDTQTSTPPRPISAHCTEKGSWEPVPGVLNKQLVADTLGVEKSAIVNGGYAPATCDTAISEDAMGTADVPIVSVGPNPACLALGTQAAPVTGASTKDVVVVCPASK